MKVNESVWTRRTTDRETISDGLYNLTIGLVLLWGFLVNALMVFSIDPVPVIEFKALHPFMFIGFYLLSVGIGTFIYIKSNSPLVSFIGYNFVVVPLGIILVGFLPFFPADQITQAFLLTAIITGIMLSLGSLYPRFFLGMGRILMIAFFAAFIAEIALYFITGNSPTIFDWIFVVIFSGYIGFDWARAQSLPKTLDNAVDCAAALYVDIVILFIRLLSAGRRR
jgi:FtsH-binding integral membrane protein